MKKSLLGLFLAFFIVYACAELLPCCSGARPFSPEYAADQKQKQHQTATRSNSLGKGIINERSHGLTLLENAREEERVEVNHFSRAKGVYGGESSVRPKAKKSGAMSSMTKSASIALVHVIVAAMVNIFLY